MQRSRYHKSHEAHNDYWCSSEVLKRGFNAFIKNLGDKSLIVEVYRRNSLLLSMEAFNRSAESTITMW